MQLSWPEIAEPPALAADEVHVWSVPLCGGRMSWSQQWAVLADDERARAERFRLDDVRRRFVTARAALRTLLGQYTATSPEDITFRYDANGKPRLQDAGASAGLAFNLAHSGDLALVAVTRGCEVGVDVERLRAVNHWPEIAERYFHAHEVAQIDALKPDERSPAFMRCWTGKEAILKALGTGVTQSLDFFVGQCDPQGGAWIDVPDAGARQPARCWLQPLMPTSGYVGAVACLNAQRLPRCFTMA